MKPTVTVDERGVTLHLVDETGHGYAVPLNQEMLTELGAQCAAALERLQSPGRGRLLWRLGRAVVRELMKPEEDGKRSTETPPADTARATDRE